MIDSPPALADDLIRLEEQDWGDRQAQRLSGLEVDREFVAHGLLHRELSGLGPVQNFVDVGGRSAELGSVPLPAGTLR